MEIVRWVVLVVVIAGIVIALFGWDRYRGNRNAVAQRRRFPADGRSVRRPETGRRMRVWYDPSTGKRDYRPE